MPLKVNLTSSELKAQVVTSEPGWYPFKLDAVDRQKSKDGNSFNYIFDWVGVSDGEMRDVPIREYVSEKKSQIGRIGDIVEGFGETVDKDAGYSGDLEAFVGAVQELNIVIGDFNGQPKNEIKGHRKRRD